VEEITIGLAQYSQALVVRVIACDAPQPRQRY